MIAITIKYIAKVMAMCDYFMITVFIKHRIWSVNVMNIIHLLYMHVASYMKKIMYRMCEIIDTVNDPLWLFHVLNT